MTTKNRELRRHPRRVALAIELAGVPVGAGCGSIPADGADALSPGSTATTGTTTGDAAGGHDVPAIMAGDPYTAVRWSYPVVDDDVGMVAAAQQAQQR